MVALALGLGATLRLLADESDKTPIINAEAGLTDDERRALHSKTWEAFLSQHAEWLAGLDAESIDYGHLPRTDMFASFVPGPQSPEESIRESEVIVVGEVVAFTPGFAQSLVLVRVERTLLGDPAREIIISQPGTVTPLEDWKCMVLSDTDHMPTLIPGDRAVLLLVRDEQDSTRYRRLLDSGTYLVDEGRLVAPTANPFAAEINGTTVDEFARRVAAEK